MPPIAFLPAAPLPRRPPYRRALPFLVAIPVVSVGIVLALPYLFPQPAAPYLWVASGTEFSLAAGGAVTLAHPFSCPTVLTGAFQSANGTIVSVVHPGEEGVGSASGAGGSSPVWTSGPSHGTHFQVHVPPSAVEILISAPSGTQPTQVLVTETIVSTCT